MEPSLNAIFKCQADQFDYESDMILNNQKLFSRLYITIPLVEKNGSLISGWCKSWCKTTWTPVCLGSVQGQIKLVILLEHSHEEEEATTQQSLILGLPKPQIVP